MTVVIRNHPPLGPVLDNLAVEKAEITKYKASEGDVVTFSKFKDKWVYIHTSDGTGVSPFALTFSLCLFTDVCLQTFGLHSA